MTSSLAAAAAAAIVILTLLSAAPAWACGCKHLTLDDKIELAETIFVGEVTRADGDTVSFEVERVYEGDALSTLTFAAFTSKCSQPFEVGQRWLVFAPEPGGQETVNRCYGSWQLDIVANNGDATRLAELEAALGAGVAPPDEPEPDDDDDE